MSKWDKLLTRICSLSKDLRFDELRKVLESYGYEINAPRSGSSHYTFRKAGCQPITIPKHEPIKKIYVEMVKQIVEVRRKTMKTLNDYLAMSYRMEIVEDKDEGGFVVSYPELPGCITCGETIERAVENAADAKKAWLEAALEEGIEIHEPGSLEEYSGQFKIRMPRSLHRDLAEHSKKEGISMNQYCIYLLSKNDALLVK